MDFKLTSEFEPTGDQPVAIREILNSFRSGNKEHTLLGVTGSGKTFTMANIIQELNQPTLIMAPNKTLAAQLFTEIKDFFPDNSVGFFISYYDYFQPEAYIPSTDTFIEKDSSINEDIDKMRHDATQSLFERRDVVIVSSVSCIYGLGSPDAYADLMVTLEVGDTLKQRDFLRKLVDVHYTRNDVQLTRGCFRVRGETVDLLPPNQSEEGIRVEFFGAEIESLTIIDPLTGSELRSVQKLSLYPNSHYVSDRSDTKVMVDEILRDLGIRLRELKATGKLVEYQRLEQRVMHDVEMFEELGYCTGVENYSRYLTGKEPGEPPPTLLDYFPKEFLTILDESHITAPQIRGMHRGDRARKQSLVDYGFRLPSALDNRPLSFEEFMERRDKVLYVSATPGPFELEACENKISEQIIRPTGLVDPKIEIRPTSGQVDELLHEMRKAHENNGRVLISTLTKKMAEDLTLYYQNKDIRVSYLHGDIEAMERIEILRDLRKGEIDAVIGINLLREGLDLPEVQLVAIMDADKEGFLRSRSSLIQTSGRAARNSDSRVIFFADKMTDSMKACIDETERRRTVQIAYNTEHGITPTTVKRKLSSSLREIYGLSDMEELNGKNESEQITEQLKKHKVTSPESLNKVLKRLDKRMHKFASQMEFEKAANLRDELKLLRAGFELLANPEMHS